MGFMTWPNWFVLLIVWCFGVRGYSDPSPDKWECPHAVEIESQISNRLTALDSLKTNLTQLREGKSIAASPKALFVVDLQDARAVERRAQDLRGELKVPQADNVTSHRFYPCVKSDGKNLKKLEELVRLERQITQLRVEFLSLPEERRKALLSVQEQTSYNEETLKAIQVQKDEAGRTVELAEHAAKEAADQAQTAMSSDLRNLAAERTVLETYRKDVAQLSLKWATELEAIAASSKEQAEKLARDASVLSRTRTTDEELRSAYKDVIAFWRSLTDTLLAKFAGPSDYHEIPASPKFPSELVARLKENNEAVHYSSVFQLAVSERNKLLALRERVEEEGVGAQYRLLLIAGRLRAQLIRELVHRNDEIVFKLDNDYFSDLFREIRLIPYRPLVLLKSQLFEVKELLSSGILGILTLSQRLLLLLFFLLTPFIAYRLLRRGSHHLDRLRAWLIRSRHRNPRAAFLALWIKRLNPYLPWIMMLAATRLAATIVSGTDLEAVSTALPYFEYFFLYRIFRLIVEGSVLAITAYIPRAEEEQNNVTQRIDKTAKFLGLSFLGSAYALHATQTVARTGLFYHLAWDLMFWVAPVLFAIAAYWWRHELGRVASDLLPEKVGRKLDAWCTSPKLAVLASLPTAVILLTALAGKRLYREVSQFESAKRVSAQLFRRKLESAAKGRFVLDKEGKTLSDTYLSFFETEGPSDLALLVSPESVPMSEVMGSIERWKDGASEEHSIAIQGEKGIGKTSLLQQLEAGLKDVEVFRFSIPHKIIDRKALFDQLGKAFEVDFSSGEDSFLKWDGKSDKRVLLIDNGQNLFLAKRGGFAAFKAFISLLNAGTKNLFWCVTFNRYAWTYLNAVTGGSEYFRKVRALDAWSDTDIRALILKRHEKSTFGLEFDPIIFATESIRGAEGKKYLQDRFFELLWEQARGNPRTAIMLWLSALTPISEKKLRVGLPASSPVRPLAGLTDDELFVIAAIIRHENLTAEEARSVTSLPDSTVRHALRMGLERGFLERSVKGRLRLRPLWQFPLTQQLVSKNFVYE